MERNEERIQTEDLKLKWREEARTRARQDVKAERLTGEEAETRFNELYAEYYAELEDLGFGS